MRNVEHSYTILLPISGESLGRWLEENHSEISIQCALGVYHVIINKRRLESYEEQDDVSVKCTSDVLVSSYGKTLEAALLAAMQKCTEEP